jgi:hypothetical protein
MGKKYMQYRVEGSAALQPDQLAPQNTPIISIENLISDSQSAYRTHESNNSHVSRQSKADLYTRIKNDTLLGSIPYATKRHASLSKTDQRMFLKTFFTCTIFALAVILIGA